VPVHGVVATRTQVLFHPVAWFTGTGPLEQGFSQPERPILQRQQVDAADDDVAPQFAGIDTLVTTQAGDGGQMLVLDQRHLALRVTGTGVVVTDDSRIGLDPALLDNLQRSFRFGGHTDPFDPTGADKL